MRRTVLTLLASAVAAGAAGALGGVAEAAGTPAPVIDPGSGAPAIVVNLHNAYSVPRSWLGLGFEYTEIPVKTPAAMTTLATVVAKLRTVNSHGLLIRVGGDSSNTAGIYNLANGSQGICANVDPDSSPEINWPVIDARTAVGAQMGVDLETGLKNLASTGNVQYLFDADFPAINNGWGVLDSTANGLVQRLEPACVPTHGILDESAIGAYPGVESAAPVSQGSRRERVTTVRRTAAVALGAVLAGERGASASAALTAAMYPSSGFSENVAARKSGAASAVYAWELGNEPDLDRARLTRTALGEEVLQPDHDVQASQYASDLQTFYRHFKPVSGAPYLAGPALGCPSGAGPCDLPRPGWLATIIAQLQRSDDSGVLVSGHTYAGASTLATLLNEQTVNIAVGRISRPAQQSQGGAHPIPYRVNEFDSHATGGVEGVSNSYAASLWMSDALFSVLTDNGAASATHHTQVPAGINVHVRDDLRPATGNNDAGTNVANAPFTIGDEFQEGQANGGELTVLAGTRTAAAAQTAGAPPVAPGTLIAGPSLYGMLMFVCALGTETGWCDAPNDAAPSIAQVVPLSYDARATGLRVFVVRDGAHELRVLFDNKGATARTPSLDIPGVRSAEQTTLTDAVTPGAAGTPSTCTGSPTLDADCVTSQYIHFEAGSRAVTLGNDGIFVNTSGTPDTTGIPYAPLPIHKSTITTTVPGYSQQLVVIRW